MAAFASQFGSAEQAVSSWLAFAACCWQLVGRLLVAVGSCCLVFGAGRSAACFVLLGASFGGWVPLPAFLFRQCL